MTSSPHGLYIQGYTRVTMGVTKGSETVTWSESQKSPLSSDRSLQLDCVKLESALRACSSAWLERIPDKDEAGGSSPPRPTTHGGLAQLGERLPCKQEVSGSTPLSSTPVERLESLFRRLFSFHFCS